MNPGLLRESITLLFPSSGSIDSYGDGAMTYVSASVYARKEKMAHNQKSDPFMVRNTESPVVTVRYRSDINEQTRVSMNGKTYDVVGIEEPFWRQYMTLTLEKKNG